MLNITCNSEWQQERRTGSERGKLGEKQRERRGEEKRASKSESERETQKGEAKNVLLKI